MSLFCAMREMRGPLGDGVMRGVGYTIGAVGAIAVIVLLILAMFKGEVFGANTRVSSMEGVD